MQGGGRARQAGREPHADPRVQAASTKRYALKDYKDMVKKLPVKMGGLGPNLSVEHDAAVKLSPCPPCPPYLPARLPARLSACLPVCV